MFDSQGNARPERGLFMDMLIWTDGVYTLDVLTRAISNAVSGWLYADIGYGHNESTMRYLFETVANATIEACPFFPFSIARSDTSPLPPWGFGQYRTTKVRGHVKSAVKQD